MHHAGPGARQFEHLRVGDPRQHPCACDQPRVGCVYAPDIGENLASLGFEPHRQCHRARVRPAPAQGGDLHLLANPLEAGHHHDPAALQLPLDPLRRDTHDPRPRVAAVGADSRLESEQ